MRSRWKFPYIDFTLLVKFLYIKFLNNKIHQKTNLLPLPDFPMLKVWKKSMKILSIFVGLSFLIYNGKKFMPIKISQSMIGTNFGEYVLTKKIGKTLHSELKKYKKGKKKYKKKKIKLKRK